MNRREIIQEIGKLEETYCDKCKLIKTFKSSQIAQSCVKKCDIGKQIRELGSKLGDE